MSLLIKGVDVPRCCCDCFLYDSAGFCALDPTREFEDYNHKRPDDCTLVEIPTPHGRLIDADRLIHRLNGIEYIANAEGGRPTFSEVLEEIAKAPTVIEKENAQ